MPSKTITRLFWSNKTPGWDMWYPEVKTFIFCPHVKYCVKLRVLVSKTYFSFFGLHLQIPLKSAGPGGEALFFLLFILKTVEIVGSRGENLFFCWSSLQAPQVGLRKILVMYGCPAFLSQVYGEPIFKSSSLIQLRWVLSRSPRTSLAMSHYS